jgi:putative membrane-bound dehydrogenase-like protein
VGTTDTAIKPPLTPKEAVKHFRLTDGLRIELVAAEPQIESPVAIAFDEDARLWVVEMRDYPNGPAPGKPPEGRIRVLEDRDDDGYYEHSRVFADELLFANGLLPWRGGVIVTAAPHIIYLKDTDGDGKADLRDILYEGFAVQNPQLRVSHPVLGLDNWVYAANGLRGGKVIRARPPLAPEGRGVGGEGKPVSLAGMDFRFDPLGDRHEAISGMGQFGNTFDAWGRRFVCDNRHHLRHIVIENRYLKRNPYLAVPGVVEDISELEDGPLSSGGKIYPLSKNWTTSSLHEGRFTAACGVFVYQGSLLPKAFRGSAFTCDPTGNLVHQEILEPRGATFRSRPAQKGKEFLATPDDWFRPVFLAHGPDDALYVVDMYRAVIEHPEFMPPELKNRPDLTLGKDKGRIWRIVPARLEVEEPVPRLGRLRSKELVPLLERRQAWVRSTAQRLLLERQDQAAVPLLREMVLDFSQPRAIVQAAWLLEAFGALEEASILRLLRHEQPRVREHGVLLAEPRLAKAKALQDTVVSLAGDADPRVRFQVALSLGQWQDDRILEPLKEIALRDGEHKWTRFAVASAVPTRAGALLRGLFAPGKTEPSRLLMMQELAALVGARRDPEEVSDLLKQLVSPRYPHRFGLAVLNGLADGMTRRGTQLSAFLRTLPEKSRGGVEETYGFLERLSGIAIDGKRDTKERLSAVRLLSHAPWPAAEPLLTKLLTDEPVQEIRLAAVRAVAAHGRPEVPGLLMKSWASYTPAVRREVLEAMVQQPARLRFLLDEIEAKRLKPGDLDPLRTRQLINHSNLDIRERATRLLRDSLPAERKTVLARYQESLKLKGDPQRGKEIFKANCATCHRVAGIGTDVGPDIGDTRTKTLEALLTDILNPNQAIDNNYVNYVLTTKSGKIITGAIAAETAASVTLRRAEGQADVVLREDIDEIASSGVSLMPEGLEKTITVPQMADLLAFLKNWRYLDGAVPVGK